MTALFDDKSTEETIPNYVGDGAKYESIEALNKGYHHIQKHVSILEEENAKYKQQLESQKNIDEVLAKLEQKFSSKDLGQNEGDQDQTHGFSQEADNNTAHQGITADDVKKILEQEKAMERARENQSSVVQELSKRYGDRAKDVYVAKANALGIDLDQLSAVSPQAVLEFFPKETSNKSAANTPNRMNTVNIHSDNPEYGTFAYWKKMKDEKKISMEEMLRQQHKSIQDMGPDKFWGRK